MKLVVVFLLVFLIGLVSTTLAAITKGWFGSNPNIQLAFYCSLAGGFDGIVYCLRGVYLNASVRKNWDPGWLPWYYIRPFVSVVIGGVSFVFLRAGLIVLESEPQTEAARAWKHLEEFFRHNPRAVNITTAQLHAYVASRREEGAAPATIRNELTALRRAFRVAVNWKRLRSVSVPDFPQIAVKNARDEFYAEAEVQTVHAELPDPLKNLWVVASWTGWRRNELFNLTWARVDLEAGVVRLDVNETKNDEGREVPFDVVPELVQAFREQRQYTTTVERATGQICPWVFHRKGKRIKRMDVARQRACERAGVIAKDGRPKTLRGFR